MYLPTCLPMTTLRVDESYFSFFSYPFVMCIMRELYTKLLNPIRMHMSTLYYNDMCVPICVTLMYIGTHTKYIQ